MLTYQDYQKLIEGEHTDLKPPLYLAFEAIKKRDFNAARDCLEKASESTIEKVRLIAWQGLGELVLFHFFQRGNEEVTKKFFNEAGDFGYALIYLTWIKQIHPEKYLVMMDYVENNPVITSFKVIARDSGLFNKREFVELRFDEARKKFEEVLACSTEQCARAEALLLIGELFFMGVPANNNWPVPTESAQYQFASVATFKHTTFLRLRFFELIVPVDQVSRLAMIHARAAAYLANWHLARFNFSRSFYLLQKCERGGYAYDLVFPLVQLAEFLSTGYGGQKDYARACDLFQCGALQECMPESKVHSLIRLGVFSTFGIVIPANREVAQEYLSEAIRCVKKFYLSHFWLNWAHLSYLEMFYYYNIPTIDYEQTILKYSYGGRCNNYDFVCWHFLLRQGSLYFRVAYPPASSKKTYTSQTIKKSEWISWAYNNFKRAKDAPFAMIRRAAVAQLLAKKRYKK